MKSITLLDLRASPNIPNGKYSMKVKTQR